MFARRWLLQPSSSLFRLTRRNGGGGATFSLSFSTKSFELEQALQEQLRELSGGGVGAKPAASSRLTLPDDERFAHSTDDAAATKQWDRPMIDEVHEFINTGLVRRREPMLERSKLGMVAMPRDIERRLAQLVRGLPKARLAEEARLLSDALRSRTRRSLFAPPTSKKSEEKRGTVVESTADDLSSIDADDDGAELDGNRKRATRKRVGDGDDDDDDSNGGAKKDAPTTDEVAPVIVYDRGKALAYAAHRFPGVLGCVTRVLTELRLRRPAFGPARMFDYGCGPGTAILAANRVWPDALQHVTAIDTSMGMQSVAETLLGDELRARVTFNRYDSDGEPFGVRDPQQQQGQQRRQQRRSSTPTKKQSSSSSSKNEASYDLCTLSYMLSEMHGGKARVKVQSENGVRY